MIRGSRTSLLRFLLRSLRNGFLIGSRPFEDEFHSLISFKACALEFESWSNEDRISFISSSLYFFEIRLFLCRKSIASTHISVSGVSQDRSYGGMGEARAHQRDGRYPAK